MLTALCGPRATRRVGAALQRAAADGRWAAVHLAVAASDLLGPEQLEKVLGLAEPEAVDPIPGGLPSAMAGQLAELCSARYSPARRLTLLLDLWERVRAYPYRPRAPICLMAGQLGEDHVDEVLRIRRGVRDAWILDHLAAAGGPLRWGVTALGRRGRARRCGPGRSPAAGNPSPPRRPDACWPMPWPSWR